MALTKKAKRILWISIALLTAIVVILVVLSAKKKAEEEKYWKDSLLKLKTTCNPTTMEFNASNDPVITDLQQWAYDNAPYQGKTPILAGGIQEDPNISTQNNPFANATRSTEFIYTMPTWIDEQVAYAESSRGWISKYF